MSIDFGNDIFFNGDDQFIFQFAQVLSQFTAEVLFFLVRFHFRSLFCELFVCVFDSCLHLCTDFREIFMCLYESIEVNVTDAGSECRRSSDKAHHSHNGKGC